MQATIEASAPLPPSAPLEPPQPVGLIERWYPPVFTGEPRKVQLSPRLLDVLVGLMKGWTAHQIGRHLFVSHDTVKTHAKHLYRRLGASGQTNAVALVLTGEVEVYVGIRPSGRRKHTDG